MTMMNKRKLMNAFLNYLSFPGAENFSSPASDISPEEKFIRRAVELNVRAMEKTPPVEIFQNLRLKAAQQEYPNNAFKTFFNDLRTWRFVAPAVAFVAIFLLVWFRPFDTAGAKFEQAGPARGFEVVSEKSVLNRSGLRISALLTGQLAFAQGQQRDHVFIRDGYWYIQAEHSPFNNESWFHFPGGGVKPMGGDFFIEVHSGATTLILSKGKIQTYSTDESGVVQKTVTETAPFVQTFKNQGHLASFNESDLLAERSDSMAVQKVDSFEETNEVAAYYNFVGSYVCVLLDNGKVLSGKLKMVWDETLHIQTRSGMVSTPLSNMTLVELNTSSY